VRRAYDEGHRRHPGYAGDVNAWLRLADASGMSYDDLVAAWSEIFVVHRAFTALLERQPSGAEVRDHAGRTKAVGWEAEWREVAHSAEREQRFGYWAPAPLSADEARRAFGLAAAPRDGEQCFGALGDKCEGGIPGYGEVQPRWVGEFTLPDGTRMGFVEIGVAVGSILHDNICQQDRSGLNCNGIGAGDLVKTGSWPAAMEWNKAAWNLIDVRNWRERFGPYPVDRTVRRGRWFDDLRSVPSREAWMAPVAGMLTVPTQSERYRGPETKATLRLRAPAGTSLDSKDGQFCRAGRFRSTHGAPLKAPWGICA